MKPSSSQLTAKPEAFRSGGAPPGRGPSRLRWPIQIKLAVALGAVAAAAVVFLTAMQAIFEIEELKSRTLEQGRLTSQLAAWSVDQLVSNTHQQLAGLAADPDLVSDAVEGDAESICDYCEMVLDRSKYPDSFPHTLVLNGCRGS